MKTGLKAILLVIFSTAFTSFGQIFLKMGSNTLSLDIKSIIYNTPLIIGMILYGFSAILYILALRYGELSVVFPLIATSFIWVSILSIFMLHESMNAVKWAGVGFVMVGVSLIGIESQRGKGDGK